MNIRHWIFLLFGLLIMSLSQHSCQSELKFDSEKWKKGGGENITLDIRTRMVDDLIESGTLQNKNITEIEELIDRPEKLHRNNDSSLKHYPVHEKYEWGDIDPKELTFLEIRFNDNGLSNFVKLITTK